MAGEIPRARLEVLFLFDVDVEGTGNMPLLLGNTRVGCGMVHVPELGRSDVSKSRTMDEIDELHAKSR
jgi:hypothetical protein